MRGRRPRPRGPPGRLRWYFAGVRRKASRCWGRGRACVCPEVPENGGTVRDSGDPSQMPKFSLCAARRDAEAAGAPVHHVSEQPFLQTVQTWEGSALPQAESGARGLPSQEHLGGRCQHSARAAATTWPCPYRALHLALRPWGGTTRLCCCFGEAPRRVTCHNDMSCNDMGPGARERCQQPTGARRAHRPRPTHPPEQERLHLTGGLART